MHRLSLDTVLQRETTSHASKVQWPISNKCGSSTFVLLHLHGPALHTVHPHVHVPIDSVA